MANLYFGIASALFVTIVLTLVTAQLVEGRLGAVRPGRRRRPAASETRWSTPTARRAACATRCGRRSRCSLVITLLTVIPGAPLRNPETGRIIGDSPLMDSLIVIIALIFFAAGLAYGHGAGTIKGSAADPRLDQQVVGRAGEPAVPVPADRAVHRLLQLLEHGADRGRAARRRARGDGHRRRLAADRLHHRDADRRPDHARGDRQVGDPRADLHPAADPPRRDAADRAGGLPRRRLAAQRGHAADGLLPADRGVRAALPEERGHRDRGLADAPLRGLPHGGLDAVLPRLVPDRDPARPGVARALRG